MADEYIRKEDAEDVIAKRSGFETAGRAKKWVMMHPIDLDPWFGAAATAIIAVESLEPADVAPYSIDHDGTLTVTVPKGTKRIGRILIEEDGTQYGGLFYPDTGGCFLSSMERSERDG